MSPGALRAKGVLQKSNMMAALAKSSFDPAAHEAAQADVEHRMERLVVEGDVALASFKSKRRTSVSPPGSMVQALQTRAKEDAKAHVVATQVQEAIGQQLKERGAYEKSSSRRARRLSHGLDATIGFQALTEVWVQNGTTDDLYRPENNAAGVVYASDAQVVGEVMAKTEKMRVEMLLRERAAASPPRTRLTQPVAPRLGPDPDKADLQYTMSKSDRRLLKKDVRDTVPSSRGLDYGPRNWDTPTSTSRLSTSSRVSPSPSSRSSPSHRPASTGRRSKGRKSKRNDKGSTP